MYFSFKENLLRNLYNIFTYIANFHLKIIALFHAKLKLGVVGRSQTMQRLKDVILNDDQTIWFHCASLGEYEQGLPVFEEIKTLYPNHKIVLSFLKRNRDLSEIVV